mgnify:CR=1 FL=1
MKWIYQLFFICSLTILFQLSPLAAQQDIHPEKTVYADYKQWPATAPGDVKLKNFRPFRAVYERNYKVGAGPLKGEPRQDRVIVTAEEVAWHGKRAVLISIFDSGNVENDDTNARSLSMFVDLEYLDLLFEIGPIPGKAKDYYVANVMEKNAMVSFVMSETGQSQNQNTEISQPGFGPGSWAMACMELKKDMKIRLDPFYSPRGNTIAGRDFARVLQQDNYTGGGNTFKAWVVETVASLSGSRVQQRYLIAEPPYYLGTESVNLETGEKKDFMRLQTFEYLGSGKANDGH